MNHLSPVGPYHVMMCHFEKHSLSADALRIHYFVSDKIIKWKILRHALCKRLTIHLSATERRQLSTYSLHRNRNKWNHIELLSWLSENRRLHFIGSMVSLTRCVALKRKDSSTCHRWLEMIFGINDTIDAICTRLAPNQCECDCISLCDKFDLNVAGDIALPIRHH